MIVDYPLVLKIETKYWLIEQFNSKRMKRELQRESLCSVEDQYSRLNENKKNSVMDMKISKVKN